MINHWIIFILQPGSLAYFDLFQIQTKKSPACHDSSGFKKMPLTAIHCENLPILLILPAKFLIVFKQFWADNSRFPLQSFFNIRPQSKSGCRKKDFRCNRGRTIRKQTQTQKTPDRSLAVSKINFKGPFWYKCWIYKKSKARNLHFCFQVLL